MPATFTPLINNREPLCENVYVYGSIYFILQSRILLGTERQWHLQMYQSTSLNQVCPSQIMTYVHSEIENGNAAPSPLFSRSLQFSERERKQKSNMIILLFLSLLSLLFKIFVFPCMALFDP